MANSTTKKKSTDAKSAESKKSRLKRRPQDHLPDKQKKVRVETDAAVIYIRPLRVSFGMALDAASMSEAEATLRLIQEHADEDSLPIIRQLVDDEIEDFMTEWEKASKVDLGE